MMSFLLLALCLSRTPSVYVHETLNDHEETPGTLLECHGNRQDSSSVLEPTKTIVETPAVVQDSKGV